MSFDKVNRLLTLFANLAVVAGILFLAWEIRQNNSLVELERQATTNARVNALVDMVIADPTLIDLQAQDPATLSETEAARLRLLGIRLLLGFEDGFQDVRAGRADEQNTIRLQRAIFNRPVLNYGAPYAWPSFRAGQGDPDFVEWFAENVVGR